jgi:hypothetical protein
MERKWGRCGLFTIVNFTIRFSPFIVNFIVRLPPFIVIFTVRLPPFKTL